MSYETSLFGTDDDCRVPDVSIARPEHVSKRGLEGHAELVIEVLSPRDESYEKRDFYAAQGVPELLYVEPATRKVELYLLRGPSYVLVSPDEKGAVRSPLLGVAFTTVEGPKLRLTWASGAAEG